MPFLRPTFRKIVAMIIIGKSPRFTSGVPKVESSLATIRSQPRASPKPPARQ